MKGLLHRLAARAAGTATAVRSDARLPFGAAGFGVADGSEAVAVMGAMPVPTNSEELPAAPPAASPRPAVPPADASVGRPPPLMPQGQDSTQLSSHSDAVALPAPSFPSPTRTEAAIANASPAATSLPARLTDGALRGVEPAAWRGGEDGPIDEGVAASVVARPPVPAADPQSVVPPRSVASAEPPRLMPASAVPRIAPQRAVPGAPAPVHGMRAAEPNEVHVHIGRIDVTAMHEPPAPRRRAPAAPAAMSLDAYLARRSRP